MTITSRLLLALLFLLSASLPCRAVELKISRPALERTLVQQLFSATNGRFYLRGNPQSPCYIFADEPSLAFVSGRIVVHLKTHARIGRAVNGTCLGISLNMPAEVSLEPFGEGENVGFRDARIDRVSNHEELNFVLTPFLAHKIPSGMQVNAAELLKKALEGSTASSGYKVALERLKIHSVQAQGDNLIVDADGDLSVQ